MKCPVCKKKLKEIDDLDGFVQWCEENHYEFRDMTMGKGFYVRIGEKEMCDLYEHSIRKCRIQNMVTKRWAMKERKRYKKKLKNKF